MHDTPMTKDADRPLRGTDLKRFHRRVRREGPPSRRLAFVLEDVRYPVNVGSMFRIADACRSELMALVGATKDPTPGGNLARAARGKQRHVPWKRFASVLEAAEHLRASGYWIAGLEITGDALAYHETVYPERVALVVGNEDHGLTKAALAACDAHLYIPMYGRGSSLNVHVAAAIVAYRALLSAPLDTPRTPST
jgi:tRNA (guanosine-2'-O-)-methyltransferase